ncbi:MAG: non-canonical purine NTP diphosphatase [Bacteroidales bacterium]|nr:non-canonical purine NTP diphosphatase [Bacteroidales bacterium]
MKQLVFATNNKHKLSEIRNLVESEFSGTIKILSLKDISCFEEIPETGNTLEANASEKAFYVFNKYGYNCFADDTGLEIETLDGRPGVYSARYAGENCSFEDNMNKALKELDGIKNRNAKFRTVISLIIDGKETQFEGSVSGKMLNDKKGTEGFGYDPIFQADGFEISFAEMEINVKNRISHRGIATRKLLNHLKDLI